jgi:hypothetical protein
MRLFCTSEEILRTVVHLRARTRALAVAFASFCAIAALSGPARADVGDGDDGLLGLRRLHIAGERHRALSLRLRAGYGYTENIPDVPGVHHRLDVGAAIGGTPLPWLGIGLRLDGHFDKHTANDQGYVQSGSLEVRATPRIGRGPLSLGGRVGITLHGDDDFGIAVWKAASTELSLLAALELSDTTLALELGYRIDNSGRTVTGQVFSLPDRLSLGITHYDAALLRIGAAHRFGNVSIFGEYALDALALFTGRAGDGAPSLGQSPSHVAIGTRVQAGALQLEGTVDVALSQRPRIDAGTTLFPVDPRFMVLLSATYRFDFDADAPEDVGPDDDDDDDDGNDDGSGSEVTGPEGDDDDARTLSGRVLDGNGAPLVDAHIRLNVDGTEIDAYTDGEGRFRIRGIPEGSGRAQITASGHESRTFDFGEGAITWPSAGISLPQATASVVRGMVRGIDGEALVPTVQITPGARTVSVAADGSFEVELPPGRYTVVVTAPGYTSQRRDVRLSLGEVTVLNVDLHRSSR